VSPMFTILLTILSTCVSIQAQSGIGSMILKDSTPTQSVVVWLIEASFVSSPDVLRGLHNHSNFTPSQLATITRLSMALSNDAIRRQSVFNPESVQAMNRDSEFSEPMMQFLKKRSEYRNPGMVQAVSPAFEAFVERHSEPSSSDLNRLLRATDSDQLKAFLSRNSTSSQPSLFLNRSIASESEFRILLNRSVD
jgi:hypothetical protein